MNATITGPCGHTTDLDLSCQARDHYACASCGVEWHITQEPPTRHPSGWIEPGKRTLVIGAPPLVSKQSARPKRRTRFAALDSRLPLNTLAANSNLSGGR